MKGEHVEETPDPKDAGNVEPDGGGSGLSADQASCLLRILVTEASIVATAARYLEVPIQNCSSYYTTNPL